jgi:hypothetical protein
MAVVLEELLKDQQPQLLVDQEGLEVAVVDPALEVLELQVKEILEEHLFQVPPAEAAAVAALVKVVKTDQLCRLIKAMEEMVYFQPLLVQVLLTLAAAAVALMKLAQLLCRVE